MASKLARKRLEELRAARAAGTKVAVNVGEVDSFYEEVDETQYKKIVRDRLDQDDFVVDDNGAGYADDGREEWDREHPYDDYSDEENIDRHRSKGSKKKRDEELANRDSNTRDISDFFSKGAVSRPKTKIVKTKEDDDFLSNLLGEIDTNILEPTSSPRQKKRERSPIPERRKVRVQSPPSMMDIDDENPVKRTKVFDDRIPSSPALPSHHDDYSEFDDLPPVPDELDMAMSDQVAPSSPAAKVALRKQIKQEVDSDEDDMLEVSHAGTVKACSINMSAVKPKPKRAPVPKPVMKPVKSEALKIYSSSPVKADGAIPDASSWNNLASKLNVVSSTGNDRPVGKVDPADVQEEDGSTKFFWTDCTELNGALHFFGKVYNKKTKQHVSCYLKLQNVMRVLYFLPRKYRFVNGQETDEEIGHQDVYAEIDQILTRAGVTEFRSKLKRRKYAFELQDVPREASYFKVLYPYSNSVLDPIPQGETFSHVFGTTTNMFEQFVLLKNIMGPCWLKIEDADYDSLKNASHTKVEILAEHPQMVSVMSDRKAPPDPPLTMMSLALRTVYNVKANKQEIFALSARVYENVPLSDPTPAEKLRSQVFTLVRPAVGQPLPIGFEALIKGRSRGLTKICQKESELLSFFLARLDFLDPDVILGHHLDGVDLSILLQRLAELKTPVFSRIGRLRRAQWPQKIIKPGGNTFVERQMLTGRLLCDIGNEFGKSLMLKCQSWDLTEMCNLYLPGEDSKRRDIVYEDALATWALRDKHGLLNFLSHLETDTHLIAAVAIQVQILSLAKVLTNLAGNSWARTLTGTRSERNEYILLHEFNRMKYICPDKPTFKGPVAKASDETQEEEGGTGKKKDKYKGGLVFEPEKGLYDRHVLVMDFNSLYPSIIQEYNICFTTVDRFSMTDDEDSVPEVPKNMDQGVLPRLIATLVQRRREVKKLMKAKDATPEQLSTWDTKQMALKLTANSMYGCLGYTKSRFYARSLAILTTHMGREILRSTKALAEQNQLQVIYGDTDSVMINANVDNVADAKKVGEMFKRQVNERYRLLEIDIDNIFRRILLQAKKKYAAINLIEKDGKWIEKMEVKGLDMRRREYCALSKEISQRILNDILSGDDTEVSIARIHEYLREMATKMRAHEIPIAKYTIFNKLSKAPNEYPNGDSMPQVQVALREIARGKTVRREDVIAYIITGDSNSSEPPAKRAYSTADVIKPDSGLLPDVDFYMGKQIFPPVERLCANIQGTSTFEIADALGLDIKRYVSHSGGSGFNGGPDFEVHPLDSQVPDAVRFANCARLSLKCRSCKAATVFEGLSSKDSNKLVTPKGIQCPACGVILTILSIVAQVEAQIRRATSTYYEGWLVCSDSQCGARTRQISVYGTRCLGPRGLARDCRGIMKYEFTEKAIYTQLVYFASLFNVEKALKAVEAETETSEEMNAAQREQIRALAEHNRMRFGTVKGVVDKYLEKCGRGWVAMDSIFMRLGLLKPTV